MSWSDYPAASGNAARGERFDGESSHDRRRAAEDPEGELPDPGLPFGGSAAELERLLAAGGVALLLLDRQMCIRWFSPAARSLFRFLPTDISRSIQDLKQKFADPVFLADVVHVLEGGEAPNREVQSNDGCWCVRSIVPLRADNETIDGAVVLFSEVVAEAISEARLYTEAVLDAVRHPLLVLDTKLRVRSANQAFCTLVEISREKLLGCALANLADRFNHPAALLSVLTGIAGGGEAVDGSELPLESLLSPRRSFVLHARMLPGGGSHILVSFDDVTESRRIEDLLSENEQQRQEQEHVRQRQVQLTNALRVSTVGELATGLAHELNQPLSSISNVVEALSRHVRAGTIHPEKILELLSTVSDQSLRAAGIVAHLRRFIEKGEPQLEAVDLSQLVGNVPHLLLKELERLRVALRIKLPTGHLPVHADRIQIEQVIVNLIQNAMDSIQEADNPQRLIELSARTSKRMGEVSIRDTGTGVSEASAKRMFEAFFTTKPHGLGMGLALSRSILEAHRGRIWVEKPADGPGAVIKFAIPLKSQRKSRKDKKT